MKPEPLLPSGRSRRQQGMATIGIVLVLVGAVVLGLAYTHRALVFEQKSASNQYRSAQAFETAEAGLEWAIAQLNSDDASDEKCQPLRDNSATTATTFRERYLEISAEDGKFTPKGQPLDKAVRLQAACQREGKDWSCSCPAVGNISLAETRSRAAFVVQFEPQTKNGLVQLHATACTGPATPCLPGHTGKAEASARLQVTLGRTPGLATEPGSPLTVRGRIDAKTASLVLNNADAPSGIALHSGGGIDAELVRLTAFPGTPYSAARMSHDPELARLTPDSFFASTFHMNKAAWKQQPAVRRLSCATACDDALATSTHPASTSQLLWIDQGLVLERATTLGSPDNPVLLVVDGPVELRAPLTLHGVVYAMHPSWSDAAGSAIHGALVFENDLQTASPTQVDHDSRVLHRLHVLTGTFARVPGSWRDF